MDIGIKFFILTTMLSAIERDFVIGHLAGRADGGDAVIAEALETAIIEAHQYSSEQS